jgi:2-dehydro-3-deoxygalactonokinase
MIAIDWGTTHLRAYRLNADGSIRSAKSSPAGIMSIAGGDFETALSEILVDWNEAADREVFMSGMVGSRQGWIEVPYVPCPAGLSDLAAGFRSAPTNGDRKVLVCPGLVCRDSSGVPDVMRGEEVQIFGALSISAKSTATICLPGTHSKHAVVHDNAITGFITHMTGEVFALLREHSILGRLMAPRRADLDAFDDGVRRARQQGGLLHHIFGVRTRMLMNEMESASLADYLSGILIGHELASADLGAPVLIVAASELGALYQRAIGHAGIEAELIAGDVATARGLHAVAKLRGHEHK